MGFWELLVLSLAVAMDALAVSICLGVGMKNATFKKALIVGLYFGLFQAVMPLIGFLVASLFAKQIQAFDHWVAFVLLLLLGIKMIINGFKKKQEGCKEISLKPKAMLPFAIATSIDALAVGLSFAFLQVEIISAIALIGIVTFSLCILGVKLGNLFGLRFKSKAEIIGGIILVLIGIKIVLEHFAIIAF